MTTDDADTREPGATSPIDVPQEDTMTEPMIAGRETPPPTDDPAVSSTAASPHATAPAPAAAVAPPAKAPRRVVRVGTIVWGLVIAAIGALILAYALDVDVDTELAVIIVTAAAGVLLLGGTIANSLRRKG